VGAVEARAGSTAGAAGGPGRAATRVADVHRQARPTLVVAVAFLVAAAVAAVVPHRSGTWLPLHLFLIGGVLSAISAATQLLAVTWSAAPAPPRPAVAAQRWLLAGGAATLALSRELRLPTVVAAAAGVAVLAALVLLAGLLVHVRRRAVVPRFTAVVDAYLLAIALGLAGSGAGVAMVAGSSATGLRAAHLTANLLGLVGVVVAATLPAFTAVQARMKQSPRATPAAVRAVAGWLAACVVVAAAGHLLEARALVAGGMAGYAVGIAGVCALLPAVGRKQLRWAGPRLVQAAAGLAWWLVAAALLAGATPGVVGTRPVLVLVVGGYAQILAAALAYLAPVLRGGGHVALTAGFATTRSWLGVVAANVAVVAALADLGAVLAAAVVVWVADLVLRAARLAHTAPVAA
jgi:nitrite reductase (NO-forming)